MQTPFITRTVDGNIVRVEDDLVYVELHGKLSVHAAEVLAEIYESTVQSKGYILILVNMADSAFVGTDPKARHVLVQWNRRYAHALAAAAFGGSAAVRAIMVLMNNAVRLLSGQSQPLQQSAGDDVAALYVLARRCRCPATHARLSASDEKK